MLLFCSTKYSPGNIAYGYFTGMHFRELFVDYYFTVCLRPFGCSCATFDTLFDGLQLSLVKDKNVTLLKTNVGSLTLQTIPLQKTAS